MDNSSHKSINTNSQTHIVSFSGGKNSTAMLFLMLERKMPVDDIVFIDTGVEYPEIYQHIKQVNQKLKKRNKTVTIIKPEKDFIYYITQYKQKKGKYIGLPYGFPSFTMRWCTRNLKISPFEQYIEQYNNPVIYIGYSLEEQRRANKLLDKYGNDKYKFPLIELGYTETMCLEYCYKLGFNWNGIYKYMNRVSCYICPFQKKSDLAYLIKHRPELWSKIKYYESLIKSYGIRHWKFTPKRSTDEIEKWVKQDNLLFEI